MRASPLVGEGLPQGRGGRVRASDVEESDPACSAGHLVATSPHSDLAIATMITSVAVPDVCGVLVEGQGWWAM